VGGGVGLAYAARRVPPDEKRNQVRRDSAADRRVLNWLSELSESAADDKGIAVNSK